MSLYFPVFPFLLIGTFFHYSISFEHIFTEIYEFFFSIFFKVSILIDGLLYLPELIFLDFFSTFSFLDLCYYAFPQRLLQQIFLASLGHTFSFPRFSRILIIVAWIDLENEGGFLQFWLIMIADAFLPRID